MLAKFGLDSQNHPEGHFATEITKTMQRDLDPATECAKLLAEGLARLEAEDYEYREPDSDDDDPEFVLSEDLDVSGLRPDFLTTLVDMFCLYNENMIPPDVRSLIVLPGHGEEGEQLPMYPADSTIGNSPAYEG